MNRIEWLAYNVKYDYVDFWRSDGRYHDHKLTETSRRRLRLVAQSLVASSQWECYPSAYGWILQPNLNYQEEVNYDSSL